MIKRTLYVSNPHHLSIQKNQIILSAKDALGAKTLHSTPAEDIGYIVLEHREITCSQAFINHCAAQNIAIITCDEKAMPAAYLMPLDAHYLPRHRIGLQINASELIKKQLWQQTVKAKISNQAKVLEEVIGEARQLRQMIYHVKCNDSDNKEAQAARIYWQSLMGEDFTRERYGETPNNALNYGYAILRAATARAIVGNGLMPVLGIFHHNQHNAFCLADDLMEPYRPFVDVLVWDMWQSGNLSEEEGLQARHKQLLLKVLVHTVQMPNGHTPLSLALQKSIYSYVECLEKKEKNLIFGTIPDDVFVH